MLSANDRRHYNVTLFLIGRAHAQIDPRVIHFIVHCQGCLFIELIQLLTPYLMEAEGKINGYNIVSAKADAE